MDLRVRWDCWKGSGAHVARLGCGLILLVLGDIATAQTVYRWEDERGVVHFSDAPSRDAKNIESRNMPRAANPGIRGTDDVSAAAPGESQDGSEKDPKDLKGKGSASADGVPSAARVEIKEKEVNPAGEATNEFLGEVENVGGSRANDVVVIIDVTEPNQGAHCLREEVGVSPSSLDPGEKGSFSVTLSNPCFYGPINPDLRPEWH